MKETAIITVRLFGSKKMECDIEIPLSISAYDLFTAVNEIFRLGADITIKEECYLKTESPITFLVGDTLLSDYGIRDGTVINILPRSEQERNYTGDYLREYNYSSVKFNSSVDLSHRDTTTIGNIEGCNLFDNGSTADNVKFVLGQEFGNFYIRNESKETVYIAVNGKIVPLNKNSFYSLKNYDFVNILSKCYYFHNGTLYFEFDSDDTNFKANETVVKSIRESIGAMRYPEFIRNSRLKLAINTEPISLLGPKDKLTRPKNNILLKLMPALGMIAMTVLLRGMMGGTNLSFILFSVGSVSMGAIVSTISIINDNKEYKKQCVERQIGYREYIDRMDKEISEIRSKELQLLNAKYYRYDETSKFALNFSGSLFDRVPTDDDFLEIRLGVGTLDAQRLIEYKPPEKYESDEDDLVELPAQLASKFKKIQNAPIRIGLKDANVIGVVGTDDLLYEMMKIIFFDLCVRQHYDDVTTYLLMGEEDRIKYDWIKWFKHIQNHGFRNIVCDSQSKSMVFECLYAELNRREASKEKSHLPHIVVFVMNDCGIKEHPLSKYIENASNYGATFIFFENHKEYIPLGCSQLITVDSNNTGRIIQNENTEIVHFDFVRINDADLYRISKKLAPVYCQEISLEAALTKNISLYELLNIRSAEELDLKSRWSKSDVTQSMAAPIGVRSGNEVVYLDGDDHHGPHGLVAGTTGSGKSEVLMTYILSMATLYSPYEVAFLIIDFKGGGMGSQFAKLPHTLGVITNIDGKEINRSLVSIDAEIKRRQNIFKAANEAGIISDRNINDYIRAWRNKKVSIPLPHLIIIVDEFAELKAQFPDFMEELKSASRIGRTLGVHLILATQKPQGQVDSQIDSNSKFRLCLKVQTPEDSREIIKSPLAAEIREAGRAYMLVGNNEIFELFQSAYSGASSDVDIDSAQREFDVSSIDFSGRRKTIFERKRKKPADGKAILTQKDAINYWIYDYCETNHLVKLPEICKPPLEKVLKYVFHEKSNDIGIYANLGIFDEPEQQRQEIYSVNIATQNILVVGSLQTGKTNILQLLIRDLSERYTPDEVNFYIIDYSSLILTNFQELAHVGGVVIPNEEEKLKNLFKLLISEISARKKKLKSIGVSSFAAYKEAGNTDLPLIILLIDNYVALKEQSLGERTELLSILREGLSVGISTVISNGSTKGIDLRYFSFFACRIGLYHNNSDEYNMLFDAYNLSVKSIPGRCIVSVDKKNLECQIYQSFDGAKEIERIDNVKAFIQRINMSYPDKKAALIPVIPEFLIESELYKLYSSMYSNYQLILGFDYDTLLPRVINVSGLKLMISGAPKSGKGNFTKYLISCLMMNLNNAPVEVCIFDNSNFRKYSAIAEKHKNQIRYECNSANMKEICQKWKYELESRQKIVDNEGSNALNNKPLLLMICEETSEDMLKDFDETLFQYLGCKFAWIASNVDNIQISSLAVKLRKLNSIKNSGSNFMWFGSYSSSNVIDDFVKIPFTEKQGRLAVEVSVGDAFYVESSDKTKVYRLKIPQHN